MEAGVVRLRVEGEPGAISVRSFLATVRAVFAVLADLDLALSRKPDRTLDWLVTDLATGSLVVEARSQSKDAESDIGGQVAHEFVAGMRRVEQEGSSPPYLSEDGMKSAQRLLGHIGKGGTTGLVVSDLRETAMLTRASAANIAQLIPERQQSLGAVEGKLETISVHRRPRFTIYLSRTKKAVTCRIGEDDLYQQAIGALGRRVLVAGTVHANARGEPISVDARRIRVFHPPAELPRAHDLYGADPDFTGGLPSDEYVRSIRGA